ncbi:MAG: dTDP-4-dehydrorhamnose reductase [Actinomycetota bacterium]
MDILVFGGWGQLGSDLAVVAAGRHQLHRPRRAEVDVTDPKAVDRAVTVVSPDALVNAAAFHKVEVCEREPERSFAVNESGAANVARAARKAAARCVFVSTDYVFSGDRPEGYAEDARTEPLSVYGRSKAAGERAALDAGGDALVVRTSGLFGHAGSSGKGGNFVETMLAKAAAGEAISVVDDQIFSPTATRDLAERILLLLEGDAPPGVYHATNAGRCSWFELAGRTFELAGVVADLSPRPTGQELVRRPRCSVLLDTKGDELGLPAVRSWEDALAWYLGARSSGPFAAAASAGRMRS